MPLTITPVPKKHDPGFSALTWPAYSPLLARLYDPAEQTARPLALGAWIDGCPVGLALTCKENPTTQTLLSLTVAPAVRRQGIGLALLRALAAALPPLGVFACVTRYSDHLPGVAAFQATLARADWAEATPISRRICGPVGKTAAVFRDRGGLLARIRRDGLTLHHWGQADPVLIARTLALADAETACGAIPAWTHPGPWQDRLSPLASMILTTDQGAVQGWVVCEHQAQQNRWHFPIGWVLPPFDAKGWLLAAYAEGALRLEQQVGPNARAVIESAPEQAGMWRIFERHFQPHADWSDLMLKNTIAL